MSLGPPSIDEEYKNLCRDDLSGRLLNKNTQGVLNKMDIFKIKHTVIHF